MVFFKISEAKRNTVPRGDKITLMAHNEHMFSVHSFMPKGLVKDTQSHQAVQIYLMLEGKMELTIGEDTQVLGPGDSAIVPPNVPHRASMLEDTVDIEVFNEAREDVINKWFRGDADNE
jgi:quercetin dioxygenase-like cupin family protein